MLNAGYGATGNQYYNYYDIRISEAVTFGGQLAIQWIMNKLNLYFNKKLNTENETYVCYADTDSVAGDSIIEVNNNRISIAEYFDSLPDDYIKNDNINENYIKKVYGDFTISVDNNFNMVNNRIKYIMKHKVKKRMYKINVEGKSVIVTEDHSIEIKRKNKFVSVKPKDILEGDEIIFIGDE